jgi:DNA-binding NarL/FixJ family response regulator
MNPRIGEVDGPVQVALVAAYPAVRAGLRSLLAGDDRIEVIAEAGTLRDLPESGAAGADVAVIDLDLDGAWGVPEDTAALSPVSGVVLLGPAAGDAALIEALGDRPWAYLLKDAGALELSRAIEAVAAGLVVAQPPLAHRLLAPIPDTGLRPVAEDGSLTPREHEVLQLVAEGLPNKTIARRLGISEHTVKFHLTSILTKLDASSRTEAVSLGARRGLIAL